MIYDPEMARWPAMVAGHTNDRRPVDVAYAALVEAGRPRLAGRQTTPTRTETPR